MKKSKKIIAVAIAAILGVTPVTAFANQRFVDTPVDHWAHDAIIYMSDSGFMEGNTAGQFMPNAPLDKFETARILARVAGFTHTNPGPAELAAINTAYSNHAPLLASMSRAFTRWNSNANREIAFLLDRGILTPADLNNFILVSSGQEQLRALSRQEATMFLVRVAGLSQQAAANVPTQLFNDNIAINATTRNYVYFMRDNGVVSADPYGNFLPNAPVSRAVLAVMTYRTMNIEGVNVPSRPAEVVLGTITSLYPTVPAIQIQSTASSIIYRTAANASIVIDGVAATFGNLVLGMEVSATVEDGQIIALVATQNQNLPQQPPPPPSETEAESVGTVPPATTHTTTLQGHVLEVTGNTILIEIRFLTPTGAIVTESMMFGTGANLTVIKANNSFPFESIIPGDIVSITVNGGVASRIEVTERERAFFGTLLERINHLNTITYVIEDRDGGLHNLIVTGQTILEREGQGPVNWNQVRIGDTLELNASGPNLVSAFAFGNRGTVEGVVNIIVLRQDLSEIVVTTATTTTTYFVTGTLDGLGTLQVGDRVRLLLDSLEIESFTILN
ncbi:MAG: S-layer homology domain-containing protein [Defluviitaleaceae bacterium]|nr:S-layer homology domain-containing protein [Defluviitaleaceae bacterium]